tara:strand:- start:969 stop:1208 length:240 start_codon:yes stop_codon:yes gene_type:complete
MEEKLKKEQARLRFLQEKLKLAQEQKKTVAIGVLNAKISAVQKKIERLSKGEQTGVGKVIKKVKKKVEKVIEPKKDSIK